MTKARPADPNPEHGDLACRVLARLAASGGAPAPGELLAALAAETGATWLGLSSGPPGAAGALIASHGAWPGEAALQVDLPVPAPGNDPLRLLGAFPEPPGGSGGDWRRPLAALAPLLALSAGHQALEERLARQGLLVRCSEELVGRIGRHASEDDLLEFFCRFLSDSFGVVRVVVMNITDDRNWILRRMALDRRPDTVEPPVIPISLADLPEVTRTLESGALLEITDFETPGTPEIWRDAARQARVHSALIAPIADSAGIWGVALLCREETGAVLNAADRELYRNLVQQAAPILQNLRMMRKLSQGLGSLEVLLETSREVSSVLDLSEVPRLVARRAMGLTEADEAVVFLLHEDRAVLKPVLALSPYEAEMMSLEIGLGEGIAGYVARTRVGEYINRVDLDSRSRYIPGTPTEPEALLAAPLVCADRLIGVMSLYKLKGRQFNDLDMATINIFATQAAIAIENARLFQRMEEERTRLLTMIQQMEEGVFLCEADGRISLVNPAAMDLVRTDAIAAGRPIVDVFPAELKGELEEILGRLGPGGERHITREFRVAGRIYLASCTAIRDEKDHLFGLVALWKDITDLKTIETQLMQSSKMSAVGQLASGVAHEFNNLIAAIYGYAQFMKDNRDEKLFEKGIRIILSSSERARDLTRSLLTFSRAGEGRLEALDLNELMDDALLLVEQQLTKEGIRVVRDYGRLPHTMAERSRLQEVFLNLLSNARHAMAEGGLLTLRSRSDGASLMVEVVDTGVGIPPENLPKVFEPFFTTKGPLNATRIPGTGLGLFTVYNIVQSHGGTVDVTSRPGDGTTFRLTFPVGTSVSPAVPGAAPADDSGVRRAG